MSRTDEVIAALPGRSVVGRRGGRGALWLAGLLGIAWPPLVVTLIVWPPLNWVPGVEVDWRLVLLIVAAIGVPLGVMRIGDEIARGARLSRAGIVSRFMLYGGLMAAALQTVFALIMVAWGLLGAGSPAQALGASETTLLLYGVLMLPAAVVVGVSHALWAGLCLAFLAYEPRAEATIRPGLLDPRGRRPPV